MGTSWEQMTLLDRILDRLRQRKSAYDKFQDSRDEIVDHFRPDLGIETDESDRGVFFGENIFEGTAPWAARTMAVGFQGNLVSKSIDWLSYMMRDIKLRDIDALDIWVQRVKEHMAEVYQQSTFYDIQPQYTLDALTIGSPVIFGDEDLATGRIIWDPMHYKHVFAFYDRYSDPDGVIVEDPNWTSKHIVDKFIPEKDRVEERKKKLSHGLNTELDGGQHQTEHTIIRAVFPAKDPIWDVEGFKKPVGDYKFLSVYFEKNCPAEKKNEPLESSKYFSRPFVVWDYDKKKYEAVSRTPAYDAIWDTYSHQQVHKNFLENMQLKNRPPRMMLEDMRGRCMFSPEGEMYVSEREYERAPKAIDVIGDIRFNKELSDIFAEKIKRHFHLDLFMMFTQEAFTRKQPLTATQIWQMAGEKSTLLSPAVETHAKYLRSVDDRMIDIESRAGRGPFSPQEMGNLMDIISNTVSDYVQSGIVPVFDGPLAKAQRIQQAVEPVISGLQTMAPVFSLFPETKNKIRGSELIDKLAKATNFPMDIINTDEEYTEIIQGIQQQAADQQQFQNGLEATKASKNLQGPVDENSVLSGLAGAMSGQ